MNRSAILRRTAALGAGLALALPASTISPVQAAGQVSYVASATTFANPERGLFRQPDCDKPLDSAFLTSWRTTQNVTLVRCVFYLKDFKTTPISSAKLDFLQSQANVVRSVGLKMIVRFAYTADEIGDDAAKPVVLNHLSQLAPFFTSNSDIIEVVESGFVGTWGEGAFSDNFGNAGALTTDDWTNRREVVDKLLSVVPRNRMVLLRTPQMKRSMYGTSTVSSANAYNGSPSTRLGHHNDCFLASSDDKNTYTDPVVEYPYLQADTKYLAMGGETCALNRPRSDCPTARRELQMFHYGYLNRDYHPGVLQTWRDGGCMTEIEQRLGYRFTLVSASFPATVARGSTMRASIVVSNTGYATPHNPRPVWLVLRKAGSRVTSRVALTTADPRRWTAGTTTGITQNIAIPSTAPTGTYDLLLSLPDPASALTARPEYAIRMVNNDVWEPSTGLNRLLTTITVS